MDKTAVAVAIFDKYAKQYQEKYMNVSMYADTLNIFCNALKTPYASVLELACGPGNITRYLLDKIPNLKITATDLSTNMLELAKANNPDADFRLMDIRDIGKLTKRYDAVMCGFCLPYISKEEALQLIADAANILTKNGVLYISTMEGAYSTSGLTTSSQGDSVYMYYHEEKYLADAMNKEFNILKTDRKHYIHNETATTDLILVAQKKDN